MISVLSIVLIVLTAVCVIFLMFTIQRDRKMIEAKDKSRIEKIISQKSSLYVDENYIDKNCEICFGKIGREMVRSCTCGKTFHVDCANTTGECPYCKLKVDGMELRSSRKTMCPDCGREIEKNICKCGLVMPKKDGTFECLCGKILSVKTKKCDECGATFKTEIREMK